MADELTVRRADAADFDTWFQLFEEVAAEGRWIGAELPVPRDHMQSSFQNTLDNHRAARFVAEIDGHLVGELGVHREAGVADLGMMVRDGYRGRGIGSALMEACLDWSKANRAHKVTLTVFPHNAAGLALYRKHGFTVEGRLVRHWKRRTGQLWDAIQMGLVLDNTTPGSPFDDAED
jgi:RimJ/RimL family protein N-acetyltransferase